VKVWAEYSSSAEAVGRAHAFKRRLTLPAGNSGMREFKPGEVMWTDAHYIGENIGDTDTDAFSSLSSRSRASRRPGEPCRSRKSDLRLNVKGRY
jgi:hypothetical protein